MLRIWVTVICVAFLLVAIALVVRLWGTHRTPTPASRSMAFSERLAITVGRTAGMITGATLAGVLVIGAGGRLLMRVLAVTSTDAQGFITDAEEVVGEVSVSGSVFLILGLGLLAGLFGLAIFAVLRRWLPRRSVVGGLAGAALGAGLLARPSGLLDPDNSDFAILTPTALAVAMCVAMLVLFGLTFGPLVDVLAARWPRPSLTPRGVASLLPFVLLVPASVFAALALLAMFLVAWLGPLPARADHAVATTGQEPSRVVGYLERIGRVAVAGLAVVGGAVVVVSASQILVN